MQGLYRKPYMPSGTPVNDERVAEVTVRGRSKMPGFGAVLTEQQVEDLLAYMKTL
jgi:mono/diheme cytochrome c family protein